MHKFWVACDGHAVGIRHALVPKTDSQHWYFPGIMLDHGAGDPRFFRSAGSWGDDEVRRAVPRIELVRLIGSDFVMAHDNQVLVGFERAVDLAEPLDKVPCEGIVVVDQKYHGRL